MAIERAARATRRFLPNASDALEASAAEHLLEPAGLSHALVFNGVHALLFEVAAHERVEQADAWCARWHLDAVWLRAWAVFALLRWEIGRERTAAECARGWRFRRRSGPASRSRSSDPARRGLAAADQLNRATA